VSRIFIRQHFQEPMTGKALQCLYIMVSLICKTACWQLILKPINGIVVW